MMLVTKEGKGKSLITLSLYLRVRVMVDSSIGPDTLQGYLWVISFPLELLGVSIL